jgi:hypothetical protein
VALLGFTTSDRVRLYNNVIANNVAGLAGGGISIDGLPTAGRTAVWVDITHNTVVDNDSTGTAGPPSRRSPPVGTAARRHRGVQILYVRIANSIVWHNGPSTSGPARPATRRRCGIEPVAPTQGPTQYAEIQILARPYWDIANLSGGQFSPITTVLTSLNQPSNSANYLSGTNNVSYNTNGNSATDMTARFVSWYLNTDRRYAYQVGETSGEATLISVPAALDEGGNHPAAVRSAVAHHGQQGFPVRRLPRDDRRGGSKPVRNRSQPLRKQLWDLQRERAGCALFDIDHDPRPTVACSRRGSNGHRSRTRPDRDQHQSQQRRSPLTGTANCVTLTGTNLTGATVTESSANFSVINVVVVNDTTITATIGVGSGAADGPTTLTVTTSTGAANVASRWSRRRFRSPENPD